MLKRIIRPWRAAALPLVFVVASAGAQGRVTSPKEQFGHNIGDDYWLATYDQFVEYWRKLDRESDRMQVVEIGKTAEGRPHLAAIVTAPENFAKLARYKQISKQLQAAEGITEAQARALAREGKSVVWIDGGLHATEVLGAHQLMETVYQLVSRNDEETNRILKDVIVLAVHANPDGMQMVSTCYMAQPQPEQRRTCSPRLYEKYAGHDNNRDFYMSNLPESQNMNKFMYWEWMPQIMYNHHQTGPAGTVLFSPPFRDPFNYNMDPMIVMGLDLVGAAMHQRFLQEGKPGFTMRSGSSYSTWWNGGLRTTAYFQNIIGILTESIGNPTPVRIPFITAQQLPRGDLPAPIEPQEWHFRQSIDYSVTANYSILDLAQRYKDQFLFNIWRMGHNQIERGSRDSWTVTEKDIAAADSALRGPVQAGQTGRGGRGGRGAQAPVAAADAPNQGGGNAGTEATSMQVFKDVLRNPAHRDPRGFIITADQPDFPTATRFVNALRYVGVQVLRATAPFTVNGKSYPAGSYAVKTAQAGRAHVLDMFEPQDHPNDFAYPGGPPRRPYDNAGWTLAYQMGIKFDRVLSGFDGPFERIEGLASPPPGTVANAAGATGFLVSPKVNDAFTIANRVLKANGDVYRLNSGITANGKRYPAGTFFIAASSAATPIIQQSARELGVNVEGTTSRPADATKLAKRRIALWDTPTGSMTSGWTRYLFERFEFPYEIACGTTFDAPNLKSRYDVIVLPSDAAIGGGGRGGRGGGPQGPMPSGPGLESLCGSQTGALTPTTSVPNLNRFLNDGGTIVAVGRASTLGEQLGLPISDYLVERNPGEPDRRLTGEQYYVPGSILRVAVDTTAQAAAGFEDHVDVFYDNSPVFRLGPEASLKGVRPVAWFDTDRPLRSGWAWGQNYLEGGTAAVEATVGRGKLYLFGPEITFRGQPYATFKFLFNGIYGADKQTPLQ